MLTIAPKSGFTVIYLETVGRMVETSVRPSKGNVRTRWHRVDGRSKLFLITINSVHAGGRSFDWEPMYTLQPGAYIFEGMNSEDSSAVL